MKRIKDSPFMILLVTFTVIAFLAAFAWLSVSKQLGEKFKGMIFFFAESLDAASDAHLLKSETHQKTK